MKSPIDPYIFSARFLPAVIAIAPLIALLMCSVPWKEIQLPQLAASIALTGLIFVFADQARRHGQRVEPALYLALGGKPSVAMLRHRDNRLHADTKARYTKFLAQRLRERAPSAADEERDPAAAEAFYERAVIWLREHTRDTKTFHILFLELKTYGFRRNLLGLKWPALILNVLTCIIACAISFYRYRQDPNYDFGLLIVVGAVASVHAAYFLLSVSAAAAQDAAVIYGRRLFYCTELLMKSPPAVERKRKESVLKSN